jgi:hypothetical protein
VIKLSYLRFIFKSVAVISIAMLVMGFMVAGENTKVQNNASFSGVASSVGQPKALFSGVIPTVGTNLGMGLFSGEIPVVSDLNKTKIANITRPLNLTEPKVATKQLSSTPTQNVTKPANATLSQNVTKPLDATALQNTTKPVNATLAQNVTKPLDATALQNATST